MGVRVSAQSYANDVIILSSLRSWLVENIPHVEVIESNKAVYCWFPALLFSVIPSVAHFFPPAHSSILHGFTDGKIADY